MKITIDTKEDSHEDIRKVIAMLSKYVEGHSSDVSRSANIFESSGSSLGLPSSSSEVSSEPSTVSEPSTESSLEGNAFSNMFGGDESEATPILPVIESSKSSFEDEEIEEEIDDSAQLVEY